MPFDLCFCGDRKSDKTDRPLRRPGRLGVGLSRQLTKRPHFSSPRVRIYRQQVDDVRPALPVLIVAQQLRGDRIAVGVLADQDSGQLAAGLRVECREQSAEVGVVVDHPPDDA
jgi:hypothetical protein